MSYSTIEAAWLTRVRAMSQFDSGNSSRGKWGIRNSGKSNQYAIIKPGTRVLVEEMAGLGGSRLWENQTIIQLWQRYKDDGDSATDLSALVDSVIDELEKYPYIGSQSSGVQSASITEVREMQQTFPRPDSPGPNWLYVELVGVTHEEKSITLSE